MRVSPTTFKARQYIDIEHSKTTPMTAQQCTNDATTTTTTIIIIIIIIHC
jgi:hypothetical protein